MMVSPRTKIVLMALAISVWAAVIFLDLARVYSIFASMLFCAMILLLTAEPIKELNREVPKKEWPLLIVFLSLLVVGPFYHVTTGRPLVPDVPQDVLKWVVAVVWIFVMVSSVSAWIRSKESKLG